MTWHCILVSFYLPLKYKPLYQLTIPAEFIKGVNSCKKSFTLCIIHDQATWKLFNRIASAKRRMLTDWESVSSKKRVPRNFLKLWTVYLRRSVKMNPIALMVVMGTFGCALCSESVGSNSKTFKYAVVPIQKNVITQRWGYAGMINIKLFQTALGNFIDHVALKFAILA